MGSTNLASKVFGALFKKGACKPKDKISPSDQQDKNPNPNLQVFIMKYLALAVLIFALVSLSDASCYVKPRKLHEKEMTHCIDDADGTWHAMGSSWRNSNCMDCNCESCCTAYSTPRLFPDDCVSVFDKVACEYIVHKKDNPSMLCPIYAAVGK